MWQTSFDSKGNAVSFQNMKHLLVLWLCQLRSLLQFFLIGIKGTIDNKENCVYRDDDMIMTEDHMFEAFRVAGRNGQSNPSKLWPNGVIPIKFDRSQIEENSADEQLVWSVAAKFNGQMNGCLSMV